MFVWKKCLVHFQRGVFALETYLDSLDFQYLLSFADIQEYYTFCGASKNLKLKGSHAHDNQVNKTNATLIEAILSACQFDEENTQVIKASLESGIWENGNNSIHAGFSSQAARQSRSVEFLYNYQSTPLSHETIDLDNSPPHTASPMKALNLFPRLSLVTPIAEPRSGFDYAAALNSDVLDFTLNAIIEEHPMYPVDEDDEVLASNPYITPRSRST
ncbi:hypothetical protein K438DRAFT_1754075 [Mycena galopus ATCC 62051]|nr:hypothetical protein K438DRAFT_1754075 [Mycena galopus ATCC 62051]